MSTNEPVESGLQDMRIEWVEESTPGTPPTDPSWNAFSREIDELSASVDGGKEATSSLGFRDFIELYRGPEEAEVTVSYSQYRFPIDANGNIVDPIAYPLTFTSNDDYPSLTVVSRREVSSGGVDNAGFREYLVVLGARPTGSTMDGDPSAAEALPQELTLPGETARPHIIHQPSSSSKLVVKSTDTADTNSVTIESESASTTTTVSLPGSDPNTVETTTSFSDIDAFWVDGAHAGDITFGITDGASPPGIQTELLQKPLTGHNTDGVDSVEGIPLLGAGSHAADITGEGTQFLGTQAEWVNASIGERLHTLDLSVELDSSREPVQESRRQAIDVGMRTVEFDADLAGPYETAEKIKAHFRDKSGDLVYGFAGDPTTDPSNAKKRIVAHNAEIVDAPDDTRTASDTNYIPSVTFQAVGDPAIEVINNS